MDNINIFVEDSTPDVVVNVSTTGQKGDTGSDGANGQGVPTGGTTGQILSKVSATDFDTEWSDPAGGGGANYYTQSLWIDSPNTSNWVGLNRTDINNNEYALNTGIAKTASMATISGSLLDDSRPFFISSGDQTIQNLDIFANGLNYPSLEKISIIKVNWSSPTVIGTITVLFEGSITLSGVTNIFTVPGASFSNTSISDKDVIYVFSQVAQLEM